MRTVQAFGTGVFVVLMMSCAKDAKVLPTSAPPSLPTEPAPSSPPAPAPVASAHGHARAPEEGTLLERLMRSHFEHVGMIRSAVIKGEITQAIEPAREIVEMQGVHTLPETWRSSVRELQEASTRIRESADLQEAAAATADIGMTCGGCHTENGGPTIEVGTAPSATATVAERMKRHQWATEKLWEGLYGPSDEAWLAGAHVLSDAPWPKDVVAAGGVHSQSLADRFVALGKKAHAAVGEKRAEVYAALLATCAPCHEQTRRAK
jgi:cytochrome c553